MTRVIGVRFRNNGRMYYFAPGELTISEGDHVIVETARGTEYGDVVMGITEVEDEQIVQPLAPVMRLATQADTTMRSEYIAKEGDAFRIAQEKILQHQLDMKLVNVEYAFNGSKVIFYFTADERVDFRDLVKDLASQFHTRIELRQIGVRDEAKMLGGLGPCGRPICCKEFLDDFRPVSIKMAKEQNLSLSPTKISGLCGRLMCCLQYEQCCYDEMKHLMPKTGKEIQTPDGNGIVMENNAITEKTRVKLVREDGSFDFQWYHYSELAKPGEPAPQRRNADTAHIDEPSKDFGQIYAQARHTQGETRRQTLRQAVKQDRTDKADEETVSAESARQDASKEGGDSRPSHNHRRRHKPASHQGDGSAAPTSGTPAEKKQADKKPSERKPASQATQPSSNGNQEGQKKQNSSHRRRHRGGHGNGTKPSSSGSSAE